MQDMNALYAWYLRSTLSETKDYTLFLIDSYFLGFI